MKIVLLRLCFLLIMLGSFSNSVHEVRARNYFHDTDKKELRFETANNAFSQTIGKRSHHFSIATVSKSEGHRISSSRPTKLIPTHGGKPGKTPGRLSSGESFLHSKFCPLLLRNIDNELRVGVAPPRYYYVIALRRLLC